MSKIKYKARRRESWDDFDGNWEIIDSNGIIVAIFISANDEEDAKAFLELKLKKENYDIL